MTELFIYLIKAAVINAVILGFYYFSLKKTNRFSLMRLTLLSAMILPLVLPLIPSTSLIISKHSTAFAAIDLPVTVIQQSLNERISTWPPLPEFFYYLVAATFLFGMVFSIISIFGKKNKSVKYPTRFGDILLEDSVKSPFSFFQWVFISKSDIDHPQLEMLLKHEFCHVKEKHSLDRIISGVFRSLLWFSPFTHITAKRLIEVHEYQADANVLQSQVNPSEYSDLVLSYYLNNLSTRGVSNNFSFHIKKRIAMINDVNIGRLKISRVILGLSFSLLAVLATSILQSSSPITNITNGNPQLVHSKADTIPPYPTIDLKWLNELSNDFTGLHGQVIVSIQIDEKGNPSDYKIYKSAGDKADNMAILKMKEIKGWNPAIVDGKPVSYRILYPITFSNTESEKPDTIFREPEDKVQEKKLIERQEQIQTEREKIQKEQEVIEKEQIVNIEEHEKIEQKQKEKEQEFKQKEQEYKNTELEFKEKEKDFQEKQLPDSPAIYPGGDNSRVRFISSNVVYPEDARKARKEGTVYVRFIIDTKGKVTHAKVKKSVFPSLDKAALDVINKMPVWTPAMKNNQPVDFEIIMPVKFELSADKSGTVSKDKNAADLFTTPTSKSKDNEEGEIFTVVEDIPKYPGGDDSRTAYLTKKINYPKNAILKGIEGTVYITFVVRTDGSITDAKVLRGIDKELDAIALNAVKDMPKWIPGKQKGKPVNVQFNMPIKFTIPKENTKKK